MASAIKKVLQSNTSNEAKSEGIDAVNSINQSSNP